MLLHSPVMRERPVQFLEILSEQIISRNFSTFSLPEDTISLMSNKTLINIIIIWPLVVTRL